MIFAASRATSGGWLDNLRLHRGAIGTDGDWPFPVAHLHRG
jgi:hypothetical protein